MKMAIAIQCHTNSEQINRLINYFQDDYIDIYIHVDKKSNIVSELDIKKNVYLIENRVDVKWGQFSQVEATLNIFKEIRNSDYKYKYIHLISGQDYPIKSLKAFKEYFLYQNSEFIECSPLPSDVLVKRGEDRYKVYYPNWMIDRPSKTFKRFIRILYREFILNIKIFERKNLDFENLSHFLHYREEKSARCVFLHFLVFQHILNKNPIPACSVLDEDMGDGSDHFSILEDRTT